jgi:hypothetical protein
MSNNFRKYPKTKARRIQGHIQVLLYKFKDIQGLEFLFSNSRTFKFCTNPGTRHRNPIGKVQLFLICLGQQQKIDKVI